RCDTGKGLVLLDGVMAATAGVIALSLVDTNEPAIALLPASIGALYVAGAVSGNGAANRCRAAIDDYESYQAARDAVPPADDDEPRPRPRLPERPMAPASQPAASVATAPATAAPAPAAPSNVPPAAPAAAPVAAPAPASPARRPAPAPAPASASDDDWSAFWREVE
ncbi:MAG TPA: hypothetical protein VFS15_04940, partial [Kofleriaceae bacterium]|nr:hypothetical protein [Kofleriaceae bacterium]